MACRQSMMRSFTCAATITLLSVLGSSCGTNPPTTEIETTRQYFPTAMKIEEATDPGAGTSEQRLKVVQGPSGTVGYIVDATVVSRSGPFKIRTVIDSSFHVVGASVLEYPGARGGEVRKSGFTRQFQGKGPDDPIRVGTDIDAMTGATISSHSMARGVRRAVRLTKKWDSRLTK